MADSVADAISGTGSIPPVSASALGGGGTSSGLDDYLKKYGELIGDERKNAANLRQKGGEVVDSIEKSRKEMAETKIPEIPTLTPVPKPEGRDPLQAFGSTAGWLAVFGSMLTRQPLTASLNASAGVINAWKEQDMNKAKQQMEVWKAETENATKLHDYQMENYNAAIDKLKGDREAGTAEIQALAASYKDDSVLLLAQNGMTDEAVKLISERDKQFDKMTQNSAKIEGMNNYMLWKQSPEGQKATPEESSRKLMEMTSPTVASTEIKAEAKDKKDSEGASDLISQIDEAIVLADTSKTDVGGVSLAPTGFQGIAARTAEGIGLSEGNEAKATAFKTKIKLIADQVEKEIAKGRFSAAAAKEMKDSLASVGAMTSPETSKAALQELKRVIAKVNNGDKKDKSHEVGDVVTAPDGSKHKITGFDADGTPLGEPVD